MPVGKEIESQVVLAEACIMFEGNFEEDVNSSLMDRVEGGCCGLALAKSLAVILFEQTIPDQGESFDWIQAIDLYALEVYNHTIANDRWPDDTELRLIIAQVLLVTEF